MPTRKRSSKIKPANRKQANRKRSKKIKRRKGGKRVYKKSSYKKNKFYKRKSAYIRKNKKKSACKSNKKKSNYIKKYKKKSKNKKGYKGVQLGCSKQRGGNFANQACEYPSNMGEIVTGTPLNKLNSDVIPQTTQSRHPGAQLGGGFDGIGTSKLINLGGSSLLTATRGGINSLSNLKRVWDADRRIESADPIEKSSRMDEQ